MTLDEARLVAVGDPIVVEVAPDEFEEQRVLAIHKNAKTKTYCFKCSDGVLRLHPAVSRMLTPEELVQAFIENPDTRVHIDYNNITGEWLYAVVVDGTGGFWLGAFETEEEADYFIEIKHLKTST